MPYRELPLPPPAAGPVDVDGGDDAIGAVLIGVGLVPVIATIAAGGDFGAEPTLGLGLALLGLVSWRRRR